MIILKRYSDYSYLDLGEVCICFFSSYVSGWTFRGEGGRLAGSAAFPHLSLETMDRGTLETRLMAAIAEDMTAKVSALIDDRLKG